MAVGAVKLVTLHCAVTSDNDDAFATGAVVSTTNVVTDKVFDALPAASVTVTVTESYVPSSRVSYVIVLFPTSAVTSPVNEFEEEIAPASLVVNT